MAEQTDAQFNIRSRTCCSHHRADKNGEMGGHLCDYWHISRLVEFQKFDEMLKLKCLDKVFPEHSKAITSYTNCLKQE